MKKIKVSHYFEETGLMKYEVKTYEVPNDFRKREIELFVEQKQIEFIYEKYDNYFTIENLDNL